jgi:signal transduction histidine kinase
MDLNKAIEAALVILANKIKKHTDHFFCNLAPDLPPVKGHFQKIEQVIINLVINALQALPEKRLGIYLSTTWEAASRKVLLKIRDQGEGMPEDIRNRILEPFFTTRQKTGGTGLGLSICYAIVSEHQGILDFDSQPGRGTTVTLSLPAVLGTAETHPQDRGHY